MKPLTLIMNKTQSAIYLGHKHRSTIHRWVKSGELVPAFIDLNGVEWFTEDEVAKFKGRGYVNAEAE